MKKCEKHGVALESGTAPVHYGMPAAPPTGYLEALRNQFPNSFLFVLGGCVIDDESQPENEVMFCPECRSAEEIWTARGPEFKWF